MFVKTVKNKPMIVGLTGGIASGKSTATKYLKDKTHIVIDSDQIVRNLYNNNKDMIDEIKKTFNLKNENINDLKAEISKIVFNNYEALVKLNAIVHPLVFKEIDKNIKVHNNKNIVFVDMPLLFEVGYEKYCDKVLLIYVDKNIQIERLMNRDKLTYEETLKRINAQMPLEEKVSKSHFIINNEKGLDDLYHQIDEFLMEVEHEV